MKTDQTFIAYRQDDSVEVNFGEPVSKMPGLNGREILIEPDEVFKLVGNEADRREFHDLTWQK